MSNAYRIGQILRAGPCLQKEADAVESAKQALRAIGEHVTDNAGVYTPLAGAALGGVAGNLLSGNSLEGTGAGAAVGGGLALALSQALGANTPRENADDIGANPSPPNAGEKATDAILATSKGAFRSANELAADAMGPVANTVAAGGLGLASLRHFANRAELGWKAPAVAAGTTPSTLRKITDQAAHYAGHIPHFRHAPDAGVTGLGKFSKSRTAAYYAVLYLLANSMFDGGILSKKSDR
jgi:hypothetical protein